MPTNPLLDELHAIRSQLFAEASGDLDRFVAGIRTRQAASGRTIVTGPVCDHREVPCTGADLSGAVLVESQSSLPPGNP